MTFNRMVELLRIKQKCMNRDCDRNCKQCDLANKWEVEEMYDTLFAFLDTNRTCVNCPLKPVMPVHKENKIYCGACGKRIPAKINAHYCHKCGRAIAWV